MRLAAEVSRSSARWALRLALVLAVVASGWARADAPPAASEAPSIAHRDLAYSPPAGVDAELARLDLTRPGDDAVRPLVLLVHGGSWASGDKAGFGQRIVPWFVERGYVAAPVNFRLASKRGEHPVVKPEDQARDVAAALAWLMEHAETYGIAREGIVLVGYSSGAHLVALLGTDERYLREAGLSESQVAGVVSLDVHAYDVPYALELMPGSVVARNMRIIRHLFGDTRSEQLVASPIHYLDGWAAPALVVSVDADPSTEGTHGYIVSRAAEHYVAALRAAGHRAETLHDATETHSTLVQGFGAADDRVTAAVATFLESLR